MLQLLSMFRYTTFLRFTPDRRCVPSFIRNSVSLQTVGVSLPCVLDGWLKGTQKNIDTFGVTFTENRKSL